MRLDRRIYITVVVAAALIVAALLAWRLHMSQGGCEVSSVCLTSSTLYVNMTGECSGVARIYSPDGTLRAEVEVPAGSDQVRLPQGLAPGQYIVEVEAGGTVYRANVSASPDPTIIAARAVVFPNGTLLLDVLPRGKPCWKPYLIEAVLVRVNGTDYKFTGPWNVRDRIILDLGVEVNPYTQVQVLLWDNVNPHPYTAIVTQPK